MSMFDDFYDNYNEFDAQIEKFKQSLIEGVKEEFKKKLERLTKENAELQEIKRNWNNLEREYKNKIREVENEKENVIRNVKREMYQDKLKDFLEKAFETRELYEITSHRIDVEKCNLCDSNRQILVKDEIGREYKVNCKCKTNYVKYSVEAASTQLYIQKDSYRDNFYMSLRVSDTYSITDIFGFGDYEKQAGGKIFNKFDANNPPNSYYCAYFTSKEEAQKYADYLNDKNKGEE